MEPIYCTSKYFTHALAKVPAVVNRHVIAVDKTPASAKSLATKANAVPVAALNAAVRSRVADYELIQRIMDSSDKIIDVDGSVKVAVDDLIKIICRDYCMDEKDLIAVGRDPSTFSFNGQYVLLASPVAQRIYALRKSMPHHIKKFSCFLPRYPGSYIEVKIRLGRREKCPMLHEIYDKCTDFFGPSMLAICPKLDGCTMELSHDFPSKKQLKEFLASEFGVNASFYHVSDWPGPSTGTPAISKPFAPGPNLGASPATAMVSEELALDKISEETEEPLDNKSKEDADGVSVDIPKDPNMSSRNLKRRRED